MLQVLYIHGFLSSPLSFKALTLEKWLAEHHPDIHYYCPMLPPYPNQVAEILIDRIELAQREGASVCLMGSSMGGFWASYLAERYNLPAVLINPAVDVMNLVPPYIGQHLKNYHTDDTYCLQLDDLNALAGYDTPSIRRHDNYWLLVQKGDETLDYQLAVNKYQGCRQTVEAGGDHSFQEFERFHQQAIDFFEKFYKRKSS